MFVEGTEKQEGVSVVSSLSEMRRRRYRLPLPLRVWFRKKRDSFAAKRSQVEVEDTVTENISSTGCYFLLGEAPPVGSKAEMEITIAPGITGLHSSRVLCSGKIVRVEEPKQEAAAPGGKKKVGVACTIDHYRFLTEAEKRR